MFPTILLIFVLCLYLCKKYFTFVLFYFLSLSLSLSPILQSLSMYSTCNSPLSYYLEVLPLPRPSSIFFLFLYSSLSLPYPSLYIQYSISLSPPSYLTHQPDLQSSSFLLSLSLFLSLSLSLSLCLSQLTSEGLQSHYTQHFFDTANYTLQEKNGNETVKRVKALLGDYFVRKERAARVSDIAIHCDPWRGMNPEGHSFLEMHWQLSFKKVIWIFLRLLIWNSLISNIKKEGGTFWCCVLNSNTNSNFIDFNPNRYDHSQFCLYMVLKI